MFEFMYYDPICTLNMTVEAHKIFLNNFVRYNIPHKTYPNYMTNKIEITVPFWKMREAKYVYEISNVEAEYMMLKNSAFDTLDVLEKVFSYYAQDISAHEPHGEGYTVLYLGFINFTLDHIRKVKTPDGMAELAKISRMKL
jgi:hypothetical protein